MPPPIPIRAHNLLCFLGYRGRGYDAAFVQEMSAVHRTLSESPGTLIEVRIRPDRLCSACPHLGRGGCTLGGPDHETHMRAQDQDVARRLGLEDGGVYSWTEVLGRVAGGIRGGDLPAICTTCPWLSLGWCADGIERLRAERAPHGDAAEA